MLSCYWSGELINTAATSTDSQEPQGGIITKLINLKEHRCGHPRTRPAPVFLQVLPTQLSPLFPPIPLLFLCGSSPLIPIPFHSHVIICLRDLVVDLGERVTSRGRV